MNATYTPLHHTTVLPHTTLPPLLKTDLVQLVQATRNNNTVNKLLQVHLIQKLLQVSFKEPVDLPSLLQALEHRGEVFDLVEEGWLTGEELD